jgi:beta-xylosidase
MELFITKSLAPTAVEILVGLSFSPTRLKHMAGLAPKKNSPTTFVIGECNNKELKWLLVNNNPLS